MMRNILTTAGAAAVSLALLAGPALAQVDPGTFTTANVDPAAPFGTLAIDTAAPDVPAYLLTLTPEVRLELEQRCTVITTNATTYDVNSITFCTAVLAAVLPAAPAVAPM